MQWNDKGGPWNLRDIKDISVGTPQTSGYVIYLATTYNGLLKSTDEGNTWLLLLSGTYFNAVACERSNPDVIYASQNNGNDQYLYKSTNGGLNFFTYTSGITNLDIIKISISPFDSDRIILGCNNCLFTCPTLFLTTNGGNNWQNINYNGSYNDQTITDIEWSKKYSNVVFLSSYIMSNTECDNGLGVFRSDDGGFNWSSKNGSNFYCNIYSLAVEYDVINETEYIYAGTNSVNFNPRIYRSTDEGENWTISLYNHEVQFFDIGVSSNIVFAGLGYGCDEDWHGIIKTTDHGVNWTPYHNGMEVNASMKLGIENGSNVWCGGPASIYKTTDGGNNFIDKAGTFNKANVQGLTLNENGIYCTGDYDAPRISYTTNNGSLWINSVYYCPFNEYNNLLGGNVVTDYNNPDIMHSTHYTNSRYILVYKTTDGGGNWYPVVNNFDNEPPIAAPFSMRDIAVDRNDYNIIYTCGGGNHCLKIWKSTDQGENYDIILSHCSSSDYFNAICVDFNKTSLFYPQSEDVYAGGLIYYGEVQMYKSTNYGNNWFLYNDDLSGDINSISVSIINPLGSNIYYLYAGTSEGVYRKASNSDTWEEINSGIQYTNVQTVIAHPTSANSVYAGSNDANGYGHIYFSDDYGANWTEENTDFPETGINRLGVFNTGNGIRILAATTKGVYEAVENIESSNSKDKEININSYPNPFNTSTIIKFNISKDEDVELIIFDILGREIAKLASGHFTKGSHTISFDGSNLATGVYFLRFRINNSKYIFNKLVLIK